MATILVIFVAAVLLMILWPKKPRGHRPTNDDAPLAMPAVPSSVRRSAVSEVTAPVHSTTHHWTCDYFDFDVVGESHYQAQIAALVSRAGVHQRASLIPGSKNPHDNLAVRVEIAGTTVGYLSRDDARSFRRRLGALRRTGQTTTCDAEIRGGNQSRDGRKFSYGVFLAMKEFG